MFQYNPKDAVRLLPNGTYQATLMLSEDKLSKAGDPMTMLTFDVHGDTKVSIREYFTAASTWKLAQLADALEAKEAFEAGTFDTQKYTGYNLRLEIIAEKGKDGFPDSNRIRKFLVRDESQPVDDFNF